MSDLRQQADDHLKRGDHPAAIAAYEALLQAGPADAAAHRGLGVARLESGDLPGAAASFDRALELTPDDGELLYQRSRPHLRAKEWDLALPLLDRSIACAPDFPDAYWSRGWLRSMNKDYAGELADSEKYSALKPGDAAGLANLAYPRRMLGQPDAALEACQAALRADPGLPEGHRQLGFTLKALGRRAEAADAFAKAIKLNPASASELGVELAHLQAAGAPAVTAAAPLPAPVPTPPAASRSGPGGRIKRAFSSAKGMLGILLLGLGALLFVSGFVGAIGVGVAKGVDIAYGSSYIVWNWNDPRRVPPEAQLCKKMFCRDPHTTEKHLAGSPGHQSEYHGYFCDKHERSSWLAFFDLSHFGGFLWLFAGAVAAVTASLIFGLVFWLLMMPVALPLAGWRKYTGDIAAATHVLGATALIATGLGLMAGILGTALYIWF